MQVGRILIDRQRIAARVEEMGEEISRDLAENVAACDGPIVLVPILTGAVVFVADLIRAMPLSMSIRPITVSSYPGAATTSQGANIRGGLPTDLHGTHVVVVDDILDSGRTLGVIRRMIAAQGTASLRLAVLLRKHKPKGRDEEVDVDYAGFDIEDEFVVGYGLDFDGYYRNLPDIGVLVPGV
ncbi:MAG: hypoxanthine phosphoribosyltransferase [Phycisphaeraceae bacterium]|nr:hypoxanthine phosphoribosyltransferase [Phycisphaeraceae bacterium]